MDWTRELSLAKERGTRYQNKASHTPWIPRQTDQSRWWIKTRIVGIGDVRPVKRQEDISHITAGPGKRAEILETDGLGRCRREVTRTNRFS